MDVIVIGAKVKEVLSKRLNISKEKIMPESSLIDDLGMDSFGAIEVVFELEDTFGISIQENDMANVKRVKDIVDYLKQRISDTI